MQKNSNYIYGPRDIKVPADLNFGQYILDRCWEHGDRIAFINAITDDKITYAQIAQQAMNVAVSLRCMGVRKGQTIAMCAENCQEFWGAASGIMCSGAVFTPINIAYSKGELIHVMNITKPSHMFCSPLALKLHQKTFRSLGFLKKIILFGDEKQDDTVLFKDISVVGRSKVLEQNVKYEEFLAEPVQGQVETLCVMYSSGTTGLPKGVMLSHLNVLAFCNISYVIPIDLVALTIAPWFHAFGFVGSLVAMSVGRTSVYLPKFEIELYLKSIEKYKVQTLSVVPPVLVAVAKYPSKYDLSSVVWIGSGAAPLYKDTAEAVRTKFENANLNIYQGYGLTETTLAVTKDGDEPRSGSVGKVVPNTIVKIVDIETRKALGPNQSGEICVKGDMVMKGYIGRDRKEDFDSEGFLKTGDVGYYDEEEYFYIVDRLKELIKYKAYQVPPAEIEAVLLQHEGIRDAGVIGIPNKTAGEVPLAFVVRQPGSSVTEKEVQAFVAERLSNPKHLRGGVRFVDQIPKNPSGKILRKELRKLSSAKSKL